MIKFLINIIEIAIIIKVAFRLGRFFFFRKSMKKHKRGIFSKVTLLVSRQLHHSIDGLLEKQAVKNSITSAKNVVEFKRYHRKKA